MATKSSTTTPTTWLLFSILLLISLLTITVHSANPSYLITASLDYETYDSLSYIRFSINAPQNLPTPSQQVEAKLFDIQFPNAFSNIQDTIADCTRLHSPIDGKPMFTYLPQSNQGRGFELMYPTNFEKNDPQYQTELNCVIKIKSNPTTTATNKSTFDIILLAAQNVFVPLPGSTSSDPVNRLTLSFTLPQFVTSLTTSTRLYPDAYPFLYAKDLNEERKLITQPEGAITRTDLYTTTITIDQSLLALRKNNKLIITHPFPFQFNKAGSFCSSSHDVGAYDFLSQTPVTEESTLITPVNAIAITLDTYSSDPSGITCQITVVPVLFGDIESIPAGHVDFFLEYSYYNKTGTSSFSNFFKTFSQRTFTQLQPKTLFPSFDPSIILSTPPIALYRQVHLSPVFLDPADKHKPFWNKYNIQLHTFAFTSSESLWVPAPDGLSSSGDCLTLTTTIQQHNCVQLEAAASCPDFNFQLALHPATSKMGVVLTPKTQLRFLTSSCFYNFQFSQKPDVDVLPNEVVVHVINRVTELTAVTTSSLSLVTLTQQQWHRLSPYTVTLAPAVTIDEIDAQSFRSPFVGGALTVTIDANEQSPLSPGFRIEILGPRLTRQDAAWISKAITASSDVTANYTIAGAQCNNCFELTTEVLTERDVGVNGSYYFPVLTYVGQTNSIDMTTITISYPGFQIPLTTVDQNAISNLRIYHYKSELAKVQLTQMPNFITTPTNVFYTLSKQKSDVEQVFSTISWWQGATATLPPTPSSMNIQSTMDILQSVTDTGSSSGSNEWFIYQQGYMGLLIKNTQVERGDTISISDTTVSLQTNMTSITNVIRCIGTVYNIDGTTWTIDNSIAQPILTIQTTTSGVIGTFLIDISANQAMSCTATVIPRYPAGATELLQIPTVTYQSSLFSKPGSLIPSTYSTADYLTTSSTTLNQNYPFTYELPVDISNVLPTTTATLTNYGNPEGFQDVIYTGSYVALQLTVAGETLAVGSIGALSISFNTARLQSPDIDMPSTLRLTRPPVCPNADILIAYSSSTTQVTITLNQAVVATVNDPYICQFILVVGAGTTNTETGTIQRGSATGEKRTIGQVAFKFASSPYDIGVQQSDIPGAVKFSVAKMGILPITLYNVIPFSTISPYCVANINGEDKNVASVQLSQALGLIVLTPLSEYFSTNLIDKELQYISTTTTNSNEVSTLTTLSCTFTASKKFNSVSTSVRFQVGSSILPETLTLPAITDLASNGLDINYSSIVLSEYIQPANGIMLDLYHRQYVPGDYIQINLPQGLTIGTSPIAFPCDSRILTSTIFEPRNATYYLRIDIGSIITQYDQVQCTIPIKTASPVATTDLQFISVQSTANNDGTVQYTGQLQTSTFAQVSSQYKVDTTYGLQWSYATEPKGQLQLVLDIIYTSLSFDVKSNVLVFDFGGMKSPSDPFNLNATKYAGGDPAINTFNPLGANTLDEQKEQAKLRQRAGILAGAALISSNLNVVNCYLPYTDSFGEIHTDRRISAQYIRETGYRLTLATPAAKTNVPIDIRCILPVYIYNQQFTITPQIIEYPTNQLAIETSLLPSVNIQTWYPSPAIVVLDDAPKTDPEVPPPTDGSDDDDDNNGEPQSNRVRLSTQLTQSTKRTSIKHYPTRVIASTNSHLAQYAVEHNNNNGNGTKSAQLLRLLKDSGYSTTQSVQFHKLQDETTPPTDGTDNTTPTDDDDDEEEFIGPRSSTDLTQDIRFMEILFIQDRYFDNAQLNDIVTTIHSLVSKRDRTISLNSLIVLSQTRPPISNANNYVVLRIGFAGLDVESTLLEAKFAGVDLTHWLSTNYEVASYSLINQLSLGDYRYNRTKVPIKCLQTTALLNQITQTCGADCGRPCPDLYPNGQQRVCRTDMDCESLNCDTQSWSCHETASNFAPQYTGVFINHGLKSQKAITFAEAFQLVGGELLPDPNTKPDTADPNAETPEGETPPPETQESTTFPIEDVPTYSKN